MFLFGSGSEESLETCLILLFQITMVVIFVTIFFTSNYQTEDVSLVKVLYFPKPATVSTCPPYTAAEVRQKQPLPSARELASTWVAARLGNQECPDSQSMRVTRTAFLGYRAVLSEDADRAYRLPGHMPRPLQAALGTRTSLRGGTQAC